MVGAERRAFEASFRRFVAAFAEQAGAGEIVAVDGKTARRSFDRQRGRRSLDLGGRAAVRRSGPGGFDGCIRRAIRLTHAASSPAASNGTASQEMEEPFLRQ